MNEEELQKKLKKLRADIIGKPRGEKETNELLDAKFVTERTGAAVSEEELEMLKKLMPR